MLLSRRHGDGAGSAFKNARYVLVLTGTPIRSDGEATVWLAYDSNGRIDHPDEGTYTLSYGQAVDLDIAGRLHFIDMRVNLTLL